MEKDKKAENPYMKRAGLVLMIGVAVSVLSRFNNAMASAYTSVFQIVLAVLFFTFLIMAVVNKTPRAGKVGVIKTPEGTKSSINLIIVALALNAPSLLVLLLGLTDGWGMAGGFALFFTVPFNIVAIAFSLMGLLRALKNRRSSKVTGGFIALFILSLATNLILAGGIYILVRNLLRI